MTKHKNNKRALIVSALSLLLCVSMLVGSTFAWFTDNATTKVNTIQAGTLDIKLLAEQNKDAASLEGETLTFVKAEGAEDEEILFEPGAKYKLTDAWLYNAGNLHVKYQVVISGIDGDSELANVLDVYVADERVGTLMELATSGEGIVKSEQTLAPGEFATFGTIELMMQTTAGNEYQGKSLSGIAITVNATQAPVESDSFGNQYDKDAEFAPPIIIDEDTVADPEWFDENATELEIKDAGDLLAYFETAYTWGVPNKTEVPNFAGKTITLEADVDLAGYQWTPISPYDSSYNGNGGFQGTFDGNGHTIYNLEVTNENNTGRGYVLGLFGDVGDGAVFKNLTLDGVNSYAGNSNSGALVGNVSNGHVIFENITVKNATIRQGRQAGGIVGIVNNNCIVDFINCTVENSAVLTIHNDYQGPLYGYKYDTSTVNVTNCTVTNVVEHYFKDADGNQDWNTYQNITLAEALERFKDEPASNDT